MNNTYYQRPNNSGEKVGSVTTPKQMNVQADENIQYDEYYQPNYQAPQHETYGRPVVAARRRTKDIIINILIVILFSSLIVAVVALVEKYTVKDEYFFMHDEELFRWSCEAGIYADSVQHRYENIHSGVEETDELVPYYAVSEYFEAASLYKTAIHIGEADKAAEYKATMEDAYSRMGDVSYLAEDIDTKLGIEDIVK